MLCFSSHDTLPVDDAVLGSAVLEQSKTGSWCSSQEYAGNQTAAAMSLRTLQY